MVTAWITSEELKPVEIPFEGVEIQHAGHVKELKERGGELIEEELKIYNKAIIPAVNIAVWVFNKTGNNWVEIGK
jgi:hypothetical protein